MYPGARSGGAGHLRQEGGPANHRPERCPSRHHDAIKQGKFITLVENGLLKWALVLEFFAPGTKNTFSPGWWLQPGLKIPA